MCIFHIDNADTTTNLAQQCGVGNGVAAAIGLSLQCRTPLGPTAFCSIPLGHPDTRTPPTAQAGDQVEMQYIESVQKSSSSLVEQLDHKTEFAPETDGTTIVTIFAAVVIYRHKNVDHLETQSELPN